MLFGVFLGKDLSNIIPKPKMTKDKVNKQDYSKPKDTS